MPHDLDAEKGDQTTGNESYQQKGLIGNRDILEIPNQINNAKRHQIGCKGRQIAPAKQSSVTAVFWGQQIMVHKSYYTFFINAFPIVFKVSGDVIIIRSIDGASRYKGRCRERHHKKEY